MYILLEGPDQELSNDTWVYESMLHGSLNISQTMKTHMTLQHFCWPLYMYMVRFLGDHNGHSPPPSPLDFFRC